MKDFQDHFSESAARYAAHRPIYPEALADYLAGLAPRRERALDCGCGNGQLAHLLADRFAHVEATDASAEQIGKAQPHPRIDYRVARAESSGLRAASVDLVTAAQAAHWFDLARFYAEVRRVARPGAILALISYNLPRVGARIDEVIAHFHGEVVGRYWPCERRHVDADYRSLDFPFAELHAPPLAITHDWAMADLLHYIDTWSAVRHYEKAIGQSPIPTLAAEIAKEWGEPDSVRRVSWPLSLRVAGL